MNKNVTDSPDKWTVLKLPDNEYKVFGTWAGGYLGQDSWKVNSGIESIEQDEDHYYFTGYSGSCYKCHKKAYGVITSYGASVLAKIIEKANGQIEVMEDREDWTKLKEK